MDAYAPQDKYMGLYSTETATPEYTLLNASIIGDLRISKLYTIKLELGVNNIFNTAYQSHLSRLQYFEYYLVSTNGHWGIYDMGRNACLKLIATF